MKLQNVRLQGYCEDSVTRKFSEELQYFPKLWVSVSKRIHRICVL